ncbi:Gfo/Idh/MocA family oxidoreductase [bacterium]|nr:Gfo/Idh/MocA family oxidoreductase [bacterium]
MTLKFAIVGCGRISSKHIEGLKLVDNLSLECVADINPERAEETGKKAGVPFYTDYHEMLKNHQVDVVSILTPSGLHAQHTIDIASTYKTHIVCEKPMALKLEDADKMISVCKEVGVRLFVVKQNRFNLPISQMRKAYEEGRFGDMTMGTVRVRWRRTQEYYDQDSWRGTWELDGGVIANQASHHIDLLLWMLGEPKSVMAMNHTFGSNIEVDDTSFSLVRFKSGAMGIIEATTAIRPDDLEGSVSLFGKKGSVVVGGFSVNQLVAWRFADAKEGEEQHLLDAASETPPNIYGFGHARYLEHVRDAIKNNTAALVAGEEGRRSLELINAIYESVETKKEVFLDKYEQKWSKLGTK